MTDMIIRPHLARRGAISVALPDTARVAAAELERPMHGAETVLRSISQWFCQHGDPFDGSSAAEFAERLVATLNGKPQLPMATVDLVAELLHAFSALKGRLDAVAIGEER